MGKPAKIKPVKGDIAEQIVRKFVVGQNRPLSVTNITDALASQGLTKTNVQKAVEGMAARAVLTVKEYGKTKIYLAPQSDLPTDTPEEARATTERIKTKLVQHQQAEGENTRLGEQLRKITSMPTDTELARRLTEVNGTNATDDARLQQLSVNAKPIDKKQMAASEKKFASTLATWKKRKRLAKECTGQISEGTGHKSVKIYADAGCELDEECFVDTASKTPATPQNVEAQLLAKKPRK